MTQIRLTFGMLCALAAFGQGGFRGPGPYEISNIKSGKVMDLDRNDQTTVIQFSPRGTDNQAWYIQPAGQGFYFFRNGMNGTALTVTGNGNGNPVQGQPFRGDPSQQWSIENGKDGNAILQSRLGKVLDIPDGTSRDGVRIQIFDGNGDSNQRFVLRPIADGRPRWMAPQGGPVAGSVICSSDDGRRRYCPADTSGTVTMIRQISGSRCIEGQTWGYDARGIWVDQGCRAEFQVAQRYNDYRGPVNTVRPTGDYNDGLNSDAPGHVFCGSDDGRRQVCPVDTRGGVRLLRQISGTACIQGVTWGADDRGIWTTRGCRAEFEVGRGNGQRDDRFRRPDERR